MMVAASSAKNAPAPVAAGGGRGDPQVGGRQDRLHSIAPRRHVQRRNAHLLRAIEALALVPGTAELRLDVARLIERPAPREVQ